MGNIPAARISPRIVNGVIYWYEGDTFDLELNLSLTDQNGYEVEIPDDAEILVVFRDEREEIIREFEVSGAEIENGAATIPFDEDMSALFYKGKYSYDVKYRWDRLQTVASDNEIIVE